MAARIITSHEYPPIPIREFDWLAYREGDEEPGGLQGWGRTEEEAIRKLLDREAERDDTPSDAEIDRSLAFMAHVLGPEFVAECEADAIVQAFEPLSKLARK